MTWRRWRRCLSWEELPPLRVSRVQLRLAIELAASQAASAELQRQLQEQTPDRRVTIDTWPFLLISEPWLESFPHETIDGRRVEWVD